MGDRSSRAEGGLISCAVVITDEAQYHSPLNGTGGDRLWAGDGDLLFKTLMGAGHVIVVNEGLENTSQMVLVEDQEMVKTLFAHSAHPTFGEGIGVGRLEGSGNDMDTLGLEDPVVSVGEHLVIVVDQETRFDVTLLECPHVLPGLLRHPEAIRMSGDPGQVDPSRAHFDVE